MVIQMTIKDQVLALAKTNGILRPRDLKPYNIPRTYLTRLLSEGELKKVGRGLYTLPDQNISEHHSLAEVCKRIPSGVVCLLSALRFHELTTQSPFEVWVAISDKSWRPRIDYLPLRIVYYSKISLNAGVEEHVIEGVAVHIYSPAKTVADCFKYRNKIGVDVAIEALREYCQSQHYNVDELWNYAKICRVQKVMQPYLEALIS